jgi:threonylcarbamoyladenosine tRNA methylthiotransferase MtaB
VTKTIHLRTLGCRLNQSEIDSMARQFQRQGHTIVDDPAQADWIVVNTCAVTHEAAASSRQVIRELARVNNTAQITVTGCYAQLAPQDIRVLPGVSRIVDNASKETLVEQVSGQPVPVYDQEPIERDPAIRGALGRTRAFVKVQDGCDNACTFCITTIARGSGRSRPTADIIEEIRYLCALGYQEAVLTGVHLGSYGYDWGQPNALSALVQTILNETDLPRLRLSSLEPWDLSPAFFELWQNPRLCRHLHLPLQSGSDATLRRMLRRTSQSQFSALVNAARTAVPGISITSDIIVGFPGETEEEFADSLAFIEKMQFASLHIFRYSKRAGTAAARMKGHVPEAIKKARSAQLRQLAAELEQQYANQFVGSTLNVLWEQVAGATEAGFVNVGYTDNYIKVRGIHPRPLSNLITPAQLTSSGPQGAEALPVL